MTAEELLVEYGSRRWIINLSVVAAIQHHAKIAEIYRVVKQQASAMAFADAFIVLAGDAAAHAARAFARTSRAIKPATT